jgi:hypothetical protein
MPQHEGQGFSCKQSAGGELVVESGHGHTMLAQAAKDSAMRHADGRNTQGQSSSMAVRKSNHQGCQVLAHCLGSCPRPHSRCHGSFVHGGHAAEQRHKPSWQHIEAPACRNLPAAVWHERHLPDLVKHMDRVTPYQGVEDGQGARRFMRRQPLPRFAHLCCIGRLCIEKTSSYLILAISEAVKPSTMAADERSNRTTSAPSSWWCARWV